MITILFRRGALEVRRTIDPRDKQFINKLVKRLAEDTRTDVKKWIQYSDYHDTNDYVINFQLSPLRLANTNYITIRQNQASESYKINRDIAAELFEAINAQRARRQSKLQTTLTNYVGSK